jgi:hypothetical protein
MMTGHNADGWICRMSRAGQATSWRARTGARRRGSLWNLYHRRHGADPLVVAKPPVPGEYGRIIVQDQIDRHRFTEIDGLEIARIEAPSFDLDMRRNVASL